MSEKYFNSFADKQIKIYKEKTGKKIPNLESTLSDTSPFELPVEKEIREIFPGVIFTQEKIDLGSKNFTNAYDLSLKSNFPGNVVKVYTRKSPLYLKRLLINEPEILGAINAGFFYLVDKSNISPVDFNLNLCIRDKGIIGLPVADRPIVFTNENGVQVIEITAQGKIRIGSETFTWTGAKSRKLKADKNHDAVLYNSACCTIKHITNDNKTKRVLDEDSNFTPKNDHATDLVIGENNGELQVQRINKGGNTNYFDGNFIFQFTNKNIANIKLGDVATIETIDTLDVSNINDAITIGPNVYHFQNHEDHEINHDESLGSNPPFTERRMARSVLYKDKNGDVHFKIFDGVPKSSNFNSVTPQEVITIIPRETVQWAYYLDPGQSSKLAIKDENKISVFGNAHYLRLPQDSRKPYIWSPINGRKVSSAIVIAKKR